MMRCDARQVQLKVGINRLRLVQQKKASINQQARKDIASLLERGKLESARVRVENIIREDYYCEALELLELYSDTLLARFGILESIKTCDASIAEAVNTIIYAAPRVDIQELHYVRDQLIGKFGKEFAMAAMENEDHRVNERIVQKFKIQTPDPILVTEYLRTIAAAYNVDWQPPETDAVVAAATANVIAGPGPIAFDLMQANAMPQYTYAQQQYPMQAFGAGGIPQQPTGPMTGTIPFATAPLQQPPSAVDALASFPPPPMFMNAPMQQQQQQPMLMDMSMSTAPPPQAQVSPPATAPAIPSSAQDVATDADATPAPDFDDLARRFEALKKRK